MHSWTISRRIAAGFITLVCLAIAIGSVSLWRMLGITGHVVAMSTNVVPSFPILSGIIQQNMAAVRAVSNATLPGTDPAAMTEAERKFAAAVAAGVQLCDSYRAIFSDERDRELFTAAVTARDVLLVESRKVLELAAAGRTPEARTALESVVEPQADACIKLFGRDVAHMVDLSDARWTRPA